MMASYSSSSLGVKEPTSKDKASSVTDPDLIVDCRSVVLGSIILVWKDYISF